MKALMMLSGLMLSTATEAAEMCSVGYLLQPDRTSQGAILGGVVLCEVDKDWKQWPPKSTDQELDIPLAYGCSNSNDYQIDCISHAASFCLTEGNTVSEIRRIHDARYGAIMYELKCFVQGKDTL